MKLLYNYSVISWNTSPTLFKFWHIVHTYWSKLISELQLFLRLIQVKQEFVQYLTNFCSLLNNFADRSPQHKKPPWHYFIYIFIIILQKAQGTNSSFSRSKFQKISNSKLNSISHTFISQFLHFWIHTKIMEEQKETAMQIVTDQTASTSLQQENPSNSDISPNDNMQPKRTRFGNTPFDMQNRQRNQQPIRQQQQQQQQQNTPNQSNPARNAFLLIRRVFTDIVHLAVPYPSPDDIYAILSTKAELAALGTPLLTELIKEVLNKRVDSPLACETLNEAIHQNLNAAENQWHPHPTPAAGHLIGLTWAVLSNVTENHKTELLRAEPFQLRAVIESQPSNTPNTSLYNALNHMYDLRADTIVTAIRQFNETARLLLPMDVRLFATKTTQVDPDMIMSGLPTFLGDQLRRFNSHQGLATDLPSATTTWAQVTTGSNAKARTQQALNTGPTLLTLAPMHRITPAQPNSMDAPSFSPVTPRVLEAADQARLNFHHISNRLGGDAHDIPPHLQPFVKSNCILHDEHITVTRWLLICNIVRLSKFIPQLDMQAVLHECEWIITYYGWQTVDPSSMYNPNAQRESRSDLYIDMDFMQTNYTRLQLHPDASGRCQSILVKLLRPGHFGMGQFPANSAAQRVYPYIQHVLSSVRPTPPDMKTLQHSVVAIDESARPELFYHKHDTIGVVRGIPVGFCHNNLTTLCIRETKEIVISLALSARVCTRDELISAFTVAIRTVEHKVNYTSKTQFRIPMKGAGVPIDETVLDIIWTANPSQTLDHVRSRLIETFQATQPYAVQCHGIPIEILSSIEACHKHPLHRPDTDKTVAVTAITNLKPYVSCREVLWHLFSIPDVRQAIPSLHSVVILHTAWSSTSQRFSTTALLIWNRIVSIHYDLCQPLSEDNACINVLTPEKAQTILGRNRFLALGAAYHTAMSSKRPTQQHAKTSSSGRSTTAAKRTPGKRQPSTNPSPQSVPSSAPTPPPIGMIRTPVMAAPTTTTYVQSQSIDPSFADDYGEIADTVNPSVDRLVSASSHLTPISSGTTVTPASTQQLWMQSFSNDQSLNESMPMEADDHNAPIPTAVQYQLDGYYATVEKRDAAEIDYQVARHLLQHDKDNAEKQEKAIRLRYALEKLTAQVQKRLSHFYNICRQHGLNVNDYIIPDDDDDENDDDDQDQT